MNLRKHTGGLRRKHLITVSGELALEEAMDLSQDELMDDDEFVAMLIGSFFTTTWHIITANGAASLQVSGKLSDTE
jgi:hypothetical protein